MKIALIYPPTCDPTAPYLAVPMLTGFLRHHGVQVLPIDANIEAYDLLLEPGPMGALRDRIERELAQLERRPYLDHAQQLTYGALWRARGDAHAVPQAIGRAKQTLRDRVSFYDPAAYSSAVGTIDAALRVISAAHAPLHLDFTAYRTPFALTTPTEIALDAAPHRDPFDGYVNEQLIPRLRAEAVDAVGLSVVFPGQLQPAYAFALKIKKALPSIHVTVGGPAMTQILIRLKGQALATALGPFDSAVVFEGEHTLLRLLKALDERAPLESIPNLVLRQADGTAAYEAGHGMEDLKQLPGPDFDGMPLDRYLSPQLVLPYDPTRGCYWGKCTFCHYGLAEVGTASYRERSVPQMLEHLSALKQRYGTDMFYLSQDSVAPKTLLKLAEGLLAAGLHIRWATDLKPERYLHAERAQTLAKAGAVACALGVESAAPRVLKLIDKGAPIEAVRDVIQNLSAAGVAAEAMCFTDFPTESYREAMATMRFLEELRDDVALFIVGEFDLTHGALVAQKPAEYGLSEVYQLDGDMLGTGLFYEEARPSKRPHEAERIDAALNRLSEGWRVRTYPWAGAVSTAHTILYYARFGKGAFRELAALPESGVLGQDVPRAGLARFDLDEVAEAMAQEGELWHHLVRERRKVSRALYDELAATLPRLKPRAQPLRYFYASGMDPTRRTAGRRPSHAPNSLG